MIDTYACAIIKKNGKYLMFDHKKIDGYTVPGGKVEENERAVDAVIRELYEEVGLKVTENDLSFIDAIHNIDTILNKNQMYILHIYKIDWKEEFNEPVNKEAEKHSDLGWFSIDDVKLLSVKRVMADYIIEKQP